MKNKSAYRNILFVMMMAILPLVFVSCPMDGGDIIKRQTVNQQMYPFLRFDANGNVQVISGAPVKELVIPDRIETLDGKTIEVKTFTGYESSADKATLEKVAIGSGIETVAKDALNGAANLSSVEFGADPKLKEIGDSAFQGTGLTSLAIPSKVEKIGEAAFKNSALTTVEIPASVDTIGNGAFDNGSLESVKLPAKVTNDHTASDVFGKQQITNVTITGTGTSGNDTVGDMFSGANGGKTVNVTIGSGVTTIDEGAFKNNTDLKDVKIGDEVKEIGQSAFDGATNLSKLALSEGLTTINESVFDGCSKLDTLIIPSTTETVEASAIASIPNVKIRYRFYLPESGVVDSRVEQSLSSQTVTLNGTNYKVVYVESDYKSNSVIADDNRPISFPMAKFSDASTNPRFVLDGYYPVYADATAGIFGKSVGAGLYTQMTSDNRVDVDGNGMIKPIPLDDDAQGTTKYDCKTYLNVQEGGVRKHEKTFMATWTDNAILYKGYDDNGNEVQKETDAISYKIAGISSDYTNDSTITEISITGNRRGKPVKGISDGAFKGNTTLQKVNFVGDTHSFTSIGDNAFAGAKNLTECVVPETVTSIGSDAFDGCTLGSDPLKNLAASSEAVKIGANAYKGNKFADVTIPEGYTDIADGTFLDCTSLATLNKASGVDLVLGNIKTIGSEAFKNTKLNFDPIAATEDTLESVGKGAFENCTAIPSVVYPSGTGVSKIEADTFKGCTGLKIVTIPEEIKQIDSNSFKGDTTLTTVTLPNSITTVVPDNTSDNGQISSSAFDGCARIKTASLPASLTGDANGTTTPSDFVLSASKDSLKELTVTGDSDNVTVGTALQGAAKLEKVVIGAGITAIGTTDLAFAGTLVSLDDTRPKGAFSDCKNLSSVTLPDGLTVIGDGSFQETGKLQYVSVPSSVTTIGRNAFANSGLESDPLSGATGAISIASGAFAGCNKLPSVTLPSGVTVINDSVFKGCSSLTDPDLANSTVTTIGDHAYEDCISLGADVSGKKTLDLPSTVTKIGTDAFRNTGLEKIAIKVPTSASPDITTVSLGECAFADNTKLESVSIADKAITTIPSNAFSGCTSLKVMSVPEGVKTIDSQAFAGDTSLNKVTLPSSIEKITDIKVDAFKDCPVTELVLPAHLTNLTADEKAYLKELFPHVTTVTVQPSSPDSISDGKKLGDALSVYGKQLTNVTLSSGITEIVADALKDTGIESLTIPTTVDTLGSGAFSGCTSLKELEIPAKLTHVENLVKESGLEKLTVTAPANAADESATTVGEAFQNTTTLKSLTIGEHVTALGGTPRPSGTSAENGVFSGCTGLTEVTLPSTLQAIGDGTFEGCSVLDTLKQTDADGTPVSGKDNQVPDSVKQIGENAFKGTALDRVILPPGITSVGDRAFDVIVSPLKVVTIPAQITSQKLLNDGTDNNGLCKDGEYPTKGIDCFLPENATIEALNITKGDTTGGSLPPIIDPTTGEAISNPDPDTTVMPLTGVVTVTDQTALDTLKNQYGDNLVYVTDPTKFPTYVVDPSKKIDMAGTNPKIKINPGIEIVGPGAFSQVGVDSINNKLSVDFGPDASVTTIGDGAFMHAPLVGDLVTSTPSVGILELLPDNKKLPSTITGIGDNAFKDSGLGKDISQGGLGGKYDASTGTISGGLLPDGLQSIGEGAFEHTNIGPTINIPNTVEKVGDGAFANITPKNNSSSEHGLNAQLPAQVVGQGAPDKPNTGIVGIFTPSGSSTSDSTVEIDHLIITGGNTSAGESVTVPTPGYNNGSTTVNTGKVLLPLIGTNNDAQTPGGKDKIQVTEETDSYIDPDTEPKLIVSDITVSPDISVIAPGAFVGVGTNDDSDDTLTVKLPSTMSGASGNGVEHIGNGAFQNVPQLVNRSGSATGETGTLVLSPAKLPEKLESIGDDAFKDSGLGKDKGNAGGLGGKYEEDSTGKGTITEGLFPDSLQEIGSGAFENTNIGPAVRIPDSVTKVGDSAFAGVTPNNPKQYPGMSVQLPAAVVGQSDGDGGTTGITGMFRPSDGSGNSAPVFLDKLIVTDGGSTSLSPLVGKESGGVSPHPEVELVVNKVVVGDNITTIEDDAFKGVGTSRTPDDSLTVVLPGSLTTIGDGAFQNVPQLVNGSGSVTKQTGTLVLSPNDGKLPSNVTTIGKDAFKDSGLGNGTTGGLGGTCTEDSSTGKVTITGGLLPDGLQEIGSGAFGNTHIGPTINIPDTVETVGNGVFAGVEPNNPNEKAPGINVQLPADLTGQSSTPGDPRTGIVDMFRPVNKNSGNPDTDIPVFIDHLVISGGSSSAGTTVYPLVGTDESGNANPNPNPDVSISNIQIGKDVTEIAKDAFVGVGVPESPAGSGSGTVHIRLPNILASIGDGAFSGMPVVTDRETGKPTATPSKIGNIFFEPDGLLSGTIGEIGDGAFAGSGYPSSEIGDPFWATKKGDNYTTDLTDGTYSTANIPKITTIGKNAFTGNENIRRVTIPSGCTSIGEEAFKGCSNLEEIVFEEPVAPNGITIAANAFADCPKLHLVSTVSQSGVYTKGTDGVLKLPEGVTSVGAGAFQNTAPATNTKIKDVILPDSLTTVGDNAFAVGGALTKATIPAQLTMTYDAATVFGSPNSVSSVTINGNGGNTTVGDMFNGDTKLTEVAYSGTPITKIDENAFNGTGLTSVVIPDSVTSVGKDALAVSGMLSEVVFPAQITTNHKASDVFGSSLDKVPSVTIKGTTAGENGTTVGPMFQGDTSLTNVAYDQTVNKITTIAKDAFSGCSGLTTPIGDLIPSSVTSIGANAFDGCQLVKGTANLSNLNGDTLSDGVFQNSGIEGVTLPSTIKKIGKDVFNGCKNLDIPDVSTLTAGLESIGANAFNGCTNVKGTADLSSLTDATLAAGMFQNSGITQVKLPTSGSLTAIGQDAFNNTKLTTVVIPDSVASVGGSAFAVGDTLTSATIPAQLTIGYKADTVFGSQNKVSSVTIKGNGNNTTIGPMFENDTILTSVAYNGTIKKVDTDAFSGCTNLETGIGMLLPSSVTSISANAFKDCGKVTGTADLSSLTDATLAAGMFQNSGITQVELPASGSLTTIGGDAFNGTKLTNVVIPDSVTSVNDNAFAVGDTLTNATIPAQLTTTHTADAVFGSPNKVSSVTIKGTTVNNGTTVGPMFKDDKVLTSVNYASVGKSITKIDANAFSGCSNLGTGIETLLPSSVTSIGTNAFSGCGNVKGTANLSSLSADSALGAGVFQGCGITGVALPTSSTFTTIAKDAFKDSGLTSLTIPSNVKNISDGAFNTSSLVGKTIILPKDTTVAATSAFSVGTKLSLTYTVKGFANNGSKYSPKATVEGATEYTDGKVFDSVPLTVDTNSDWTYGVSRYGYDASETKVDVNAHWLTPADRTRTVTWTPKKVKVTLQNGKLAGTTTTPTAPTNWTFGEAKEFDFETTPTVGNPSRVGYTFNGWTGLSLITSTDPVTYTAQWMPKTNLSVTINTDGGSMISNLTGKTFDSTYTLPAAPTKTGYQFKEWQYSDGRTTAKAGDAVNNWPTTDVNPTWKATWTANIYKYTFNNNGGTGGSVNISVTYNSPVNPTSPTRTGYDFMGWASASVSNDYHINFSPSNGYFGEKEMTNPENTVPTLHAIWKAKTYTVTLNGISKTVTYGDRWSTALGTWNTNNTRYTVNGTVINPTDKISILANTTISVSYLVTFSVSPANAGSVYPSSVWIPHNDSVSRYVSFSPSSGYTFKQWSQTTITGPGSVVCYAETNRPAQGTSGIGTSPALSGGSITGYNIGNGYFAVVWDVTGGDGSWLNASGASWVTGGKTYSLQNGYTFRQLLATRAQLDYCKNLGLVPDKSNINHNGMYYISDGSGGVAYYNPYTQSYSTTMPSTGGAWTFPVFPYS